MPFKGTQARGGKRAGAGRKPKAATIAKRLLIENKILEAEKSFAFLVALRDNKDESSSLRKEAAIWIYEAVNGKAKQPQEQSGELIVRVIRDDGNSNQTPAPTPGASADQERSEAV